MITVTKYTVGQTVEGTVTGIQKYGVFVQLDEHTQGLIHISEIQNGFVEDVHKFVKMGQIVRVLIIDIDEYTKKISLSLRALASSNTMTYPARIKRKPRRYSPNIGFSTVKKALPHWIKEGLDNIHYDEYHIPS